MTGKKGTKTNKPNGHLPLSFLSLTERSVCDDQDLSAENRLEIPVWITGHVHHATTIHLSSVNFNNLFSITTKDSHEPINQSQSSIKLLSFNSQPCHQIAIDIQDFIVDNNIDVLMLKETWLCSHGDEAYIAAMTPAVLSSVRSLVQDLEEEVSALLQERPCTCVSFRPLHNRSFEAVEMWLSLDHVSVVHLCLYQLPLSKCNNLTNSMFLQAFPKLLPQFTNKTEVMPVGSASRLGLVDHECANISGNSVPSKPC